MFIEAITPFNDPFEQPYITITTSEGFNKVCSDEEASFNGVCEIGNYELTDGKVFTLDIYCLVDCQFTITAYLSPIFSMPIGLKYELSAM